MIQLGLVRTGLVRSGQVRTCYLHMMRWTSNINYAWVCSTFINRLPPMVWNLPQVSRNIWHIGSIIQRRNPLSLSSSSGCWDIAILQTDKQTQILLSACQLLCLVMHISCLFIFAFNVLTGMATGDVIRIVIRSISERCNVCRNNNNKFFNNNKFL